MRNDRNAALKLRLSGRSYNEIKKLLGIPKSTLSGWLAGVNLSVKAQRRIQKRVHEGSLKGLLKRNRNQTHLAIKRMHAIRAESRREITRMIENELRLVGIALYWAEGYKRPAVRNGRELTHHSVALTNSDPKMIKVFLRFLREICLVSDKDIHADIRIYEHMNEGDLLVFWQRITGLPKENFGKVYYGVSKSSLGKRPFSRLPHGTIQIRVNNTKLFHKIMGWIEGLSTQTEAPRP